MVSSNVNGIEVKNFNAFEALNEKLFTHITASINSTSQFDKEHPLDRTKWRAEFLQ